jgi:putative flippase GtrA
MDREWVRRELRMVGSFIAVGIVVAGTNFAVYGGLIALGLHYLPAAVAGFVVSASVSYAGNKRFTFLDAPPTSGVQAARFMGVQLVGLLVNLVVLTLGVEVGSIAEFPAEVIASGCQSTFTFLANRLWVFRARAPTAAAGS